MKSQNRTYKIRKSTGEMVELPSVTTILKIKHSEALFQWALNKGKEKAEKLRDEAADIGTSVHQAIENYLKTQQPIVFKPEIDERIVKGIQAFQDWEKQVNLKIIATEQVVYSDNGYAGRFDLLGFINDKITVADWKTSSGIYNTMLVQGAAYYEAVCEMVSKSERLCWNDTDKLYDVVRVSSSGAMPDSIAVIRLDKKTGAFDPKIISDKAAINQLHNIFVKMIALYEWNKKTDSRELIEEHYK
ncbi:MAG: hypothetical protein QME51_08615 [Planctomycetota bacterium]|nr:hypothetical protein [Planctomycetota bacterium]